MLAEYKTKTNIGVGTGLVLQLLGKSAARGDVESLAFVGGIASLIGAGFFVWGCMSYAKGKGHHGAWGLLGLLSLIGLVVLVLFRDRHKTATA